MKYDKIKTTLRKGRKKALTLLEALLVLGIAAFVINAALQLDQEANNQTKGQSAQQEIATIYGIVDQNVPQSQLSSLTAAELVASGKLPAAYVKVYPVPKRGLGISSKIYDPWGGVIIIGPGIMLPQNFVAILTNVPQSDCVTLATNSFPGLYSTTVGGVSSPIGSPLSFSDATNNCVSGSTNAITLEFSE